MMDNVPAEARPVEWQCTHLNNHQLSPYNSNDFNRVNFCVHVDRAPTCPLNVNPNNGENAEAKPIVHPVLTKEDGGIYEKNNLKSYYMQPYSHYLGAEMPSTPQNELTYVLYQQQGRWKILITHQPNRHETVLLPSAFCQQTGIASFLSQQTQKLQRNNRKSNSISNFPQELVAFIKKAAQQPHEERILTQGFSRITRALFSPHQQRTVRFSYRLALHSKIDPRKTFGGSNQEAALVGIFRSETNIQSTLLMIEKKDAHQCGCLDTYVMKPDQYPDESITQGVKKTAFHDRQYAMLTQHELLTGHGISAKQAKARTFVISRNQRDSLEQAIGASEKKMAAGHLRYHHRPGKLAINLMAWFFTTSEPVEYMNEASWCLAMLTQSGVYNDSLSFDQDYEIIPAESQPWTVSFFGATPERLLQNPAQHQPSC